MENYHIEMVDNMPHIAPYIRITFDAKVDQDVVGTHLNVIDGVKKVNFDTKDCKVTAIVYLFQDKDRNIIKDPIFSINH